MSVNVVRLQRRQLPSQSDLPSIPPAFIIGLCCADFDLNLQVRTNCCVFPTDHSFNCVKKNVSIPHVLSCAMMAIVQCEKQSSSIDMQCPSTFDPQLWINGSSTSSMDVKGEQ
jgi:hypothetical protein